ncbi:hypothetical protein BC939DRAFT_436731 [Gamsiella multidivaricata]|uniref:uncharacterized protein n=1 Tax=Gamsiella multidivaricata TaxID=101098 RepID=UPI00221F3A4D|nr:uncharacterized protein BC939DRAFT_436731 [Gamsiella multidivaricata]KAG0369671.1 hypothetical protein BGZ54_009235 [Gamsiella multidivaricata]KAI7831826.1 hypothetical protein BC939DRAFT_436731 [Gamsiella multidivaricata]
MSMDDRKKAAAASDTKKVFGHSPDQHILNVVKESCQDAFNLPSFTTTLQTIKSYFYDRNYDAVFQNPAHLPVYSARYAPSRALCYYHMFLDHPVLMRTLEGGPSTILCIGSGAGSELVGISAAMVHANPVPKIKKKKKSTTAISEEKKAKGKDSSEADSEVALKEEASVETSDDTATFGLNNLALSTTSDTAIADSTTAEEATATCSKATKAKKSKTNKHQVTIVMQDYVDWSSILDPMETVVRARMQLGPERLQCETEVGNVLDLSDGLLERVAKANLITFMFVLNELFQDKKKTMLLVAKMVAAMPTGAHMLVVDSAGSFSNLRVGERTYMVYMLLDHLKDLETVYQDDATWYRCPPSVTYPLKLENMRHFVRIYRKL